jgi:uncharacterized protein DUF2510
LNRPERGASVLFTGQNDRAPDAVCRLPFGLSRPADRVHPYPEGVRMISIRGHGIAGLLHARRRAAPRAIEPALPADRHVAEPPPPWPLAPPPPGADPAPGWFPDPRHSGARRYWDGDFWTEHLWHDRGDARRRRLRS